MQDKHPSLKILKNYSLKSHNTFGLDVKTRHFIQVDTISELTEILNLEEYKSIPKLILGGGSNFLFTKTFEGLVIHNNISGISFQYEENDTVLVTAGAGIVWHQLVLNSINKGLSGIENLSLIPGTVGAAPIQNIGAYGVELKDVFHSLSAIEINTGTIRKFNKQDCDFGYRNSVFKNKLKNKFIVTEVTLDLSSIAQSNVSYGDILKTLAKQGNTENITPKTISDAVIAIRTSKLPNPEEIGNAGSFFKNPVIDTIDFQGLKAEFNNIPGYELSSTEVKVPAAWLIEQCGWKGFRDGDIGVHVNHPLVLVNYGNGNGVKLKDLAFKIQKSVSEKFGIVLSPEVNIL